MNAIYRQGRFEDFPKLNWAWGEKQSYTQKQFINTINANHQEFWISEIQDRLVGEIHIVWLSEDADQANGINRAYLCTYRVHPEYQGKGIGGTLMKAVIQRIKDKGCTEITIGVNPREPHLVEMYGKWGFNTHIKSKTIDHHWFNADGTFKTVEPFKIFLKNLY